MFGGIALILAGVLIALFPQLLSIIVATLLVLAGIAWLLVARHYRRMKRHAANPVTEFFIRF